MKNIAVYQNLEDDIAQRFVAKPVVIENANFVDLRG